MKIKDFLNYGSPSPSQATGSVSQKTQIDALAKKKTNQSTTNPPAFMTTINIHVEKPAIILLEDMDDIDSNCIVLNVRHLFVMEIRIMYTNNIQLIYIFFFQTELLFKIRILGEHQVITGSIKNLKILAGVYNPAKRSEWIYEVSNKRLSKKLESIFIAILIKMNFEPPRC